MNSKILTKRILLAVYVVMITIITLLAFEWVSTYRDYAQVPEYSEMKDELKLKANPDEVLYATSYTDENGREVVKYAYATGEVSPLLDEDIARRTPNSQTRVLDVRQEEDKKIETLETTFYTSPQFYEKDGQWHQVEYATTTPEIFTMSGAVQSLKRRELAWKLLPGESAFALTGGPYYPATGTGGDSVDGYFFQQSSVSWADVRGAADASTVNETDTYIYAIADTSWDNCGGYCGAYDIWTIYRSAILFPTSSLPDSITISAANIQVYLYSKSNGDNDGDDTVSLVSSSPAASNDLAVGDYDSFGTTHLATALDITSMTTGAYNTFTLNSSGFANISKTGVSYFGLREGHDVVNTAPTAYSGNSAVMYSADQAGTSQDPKLTVTYELATFSMGQWFPF